MSQPDADLARRGGSAHRFRAVIFAALVIAVAPLLLDFARLVWLRSDDTQGPVLALAAAYAFWRDRSLLEGQTEGKALPAGAALMMVGYAAAVIGIGQAFIQIEGLALILIGLGAILCLGGVRAIVRFRYVELALLFVVPLPRSQADWLLLSLKSLLSDMIVGLLHALDYPVAHSGVVLFIGFSQLQLADACAGLNSILSLLAVGLLFIHFMTPARKHTAPLLILLAPLIALAANFVRVLALVLVVYYFGSGAETAIHDIAGLLELGCALLLFFGAFALLDGRARRGRA